MNIKGLTRNLATTETVRTTVPSKELKSSSSSDRDANGQQQQQEPERRKLTDEELKIAIEQLEQIPGIKNNHLVVKCVTENNMRVVVIEDMFGKVVRRIPEMDLLSLIKNRGSDKGQIYNRSM